MSRAVMQQALEALEEAHWKIEHKQDAVKRSQAITALRAALAEPEQEPVAWVEPKWLDPDKRGWPSDSFESVPIEGWLPLYTAPTPRKPLTDEELRECWDQVGNNETVWAMRVQFARAIEAAHGITGETK